MPSLYQPVHGCTSSPHLQAALITVEETQVVDGVERGCVLRPHAFSLPASARLYIISASSGGLGQRRGDPRLLTMSSVDVCSGPHAFS
jgi:hypothetical protein